MRVISLALAALAACSAPADVAAQPDRIAGSDIRRSELPRQTGRVVDTADILSPATEAEIADVSARLEGRTGDQLVVVTVPDLNGRTIAQMGLAIGRGWGVGQRDRNNGLVLLVAKGDRKVRIEVGCGLERIVPDERAAEIIRDRIVPAFQTQRFDDGVRAGVQALTDTLQSAAAVPRGGGCGS